MVEVFMSSVKFIAVFMKQKTRGLERNTIPNAERTLNLQQTHSTTATRVLMGNAHYSAPSSRTQKAAGRGSYSCPPLGARAIFLTKRVIASKASLFIVKTIHTSELSLDRITLAQR